jgi:hypothetical protein
MPFLLPPLESEQREGGGGAGAASRRQSPANRATVAGVRWCKTKRTPRGFDSPTYLEWWWRAEVESPAAADWKGELGGGVPVSKGGRLGLWWFKVRRGTVGLHL